MEIIGTREIFMVILSCVNSWINAISLIGGSAIIFAIGYFIENERKKKSKHQDEVFNRSEFLRMMKQEQENRPKILEDEFDFKLIAKERFWRLNIDKAVRDYLVAKGEKWNNNHSMYILVEKFEEKYKPNLFEFLNFKIPSNYVSSYSQLCPYILEYDQMKNKK